MEYTFPTAQPEKLGISPEAVRAAIDNIRIENGLELHSFLLLRNGALAWEEYFRKGEAERMHVLWSVSKSFLSSAFGIAQGEGMLSLDDKLYDFFPEYAYACDSDYKREMSLRHLLMMGSGFENRESEIFADAFSYHMALKALELPAIHRPGTVFNYYTLGSYLLSVVFSKVYPAGVHSYLRTKLLDPLGIGASHWNTDPNYIPFGGVGLFLRAIDLTKLGQLYLMDGEWEGRQLVPREYVRMATSAQIDNGSDTPSPLCLNPDWNAGYGYHFWCNTFGGFRADGMHGQYVVALPEKSLVIVMTSNHNEMQVPLTAVKELLLPGVG